MEEKIYERQVTKQSAGSARGGRTPNWPTISRPRDLAELYTFKPDRLDDPNRVEKTPMLPKVWYTCMLH